MKKLLDKEQMQKLKELGIDTSVSESFDLQDLIELIYSIGYNGFICFYQKENWVHLEHDDDWENSRSCFCLKKNKPMIDCTFEIIVWLIENKEKTNNFKYFIGGY